MQQIHATSHSAALSCAGIAPVWSASEYIALLEGIRTRGAVFRRLEEYSHGVPGVWLRHDVELSLDAALVMASAEHDTGIDSCYYVCVDSPFLPREPVVVREFVSRIQDLGHLVSFHLPVSRSIPARVDELRQDFPQIRPSSLTFHAPKVPAATLADLPLGASVYKPMTRPGTAYFSDSTGRWRYGSPIEPGPLDLDRPTQLLTHPYWWSAGTGAGCPLSLDADRAAFLPGLAAYSRPSEADRGG
jgi:hypothetical protein